MILASYEDTSYALASWQRFESTVTNDLLRAITSAFALVATADGDLAEEEISRFAALLAEQSPPMAQLSPTSIEHAFSDATMALLSDPETYRRRALEIVTTAIKNDTERKTVIAAAEIALNADHRNRQGEQKALGEIRSALGMVA
jgi:tellurite resistance protein